MRKILITDDSNFSRDLIGDVLSEDYEVFYAYDGEEMVAKYREIKPDVVISDILMPKLDGMRAVEQIREFDQDARVIFCSANKQKFVVDEAKRLGVNSFVEKPLSINKLVEAVRTELER